jgi:3-phenylpropionate/trans-cinnamate dioxygenase ferredoxin component
MAEWLSVAKEDQAQEGIPLSVDVDGADVLVIKMAGKLYAIENLCNHDNDVLEGGEIEGEEIVCPRHGAHFCIKTGKVKSPPAYADVATFPVQVKDGLIQVKDERWD